MPFEGCDALIETAFGHGYVRRGRPKNDAERPPRCIKANGEPIGRRFEFADIAGPMVMHQRLGIGWMQLWRWPPKASRGFAQKMMEEQDAVLAALPEGARAMVARLSR